MGNGERPAWLPDGTRRSGKVKGATKFWICDKVKEWLAVDPTVGPTELKRRLKEHFKVKISYKRVYDGRSLAMDQLYGTWNQTPAQRMVFPVLPIVVDLSKKRKKKPSSSTRAKKQKSTSTTSIPEASDPSVRGSATGSNQPELLAITYPAASSEQHLADKSTPKKKMCVKKILSPNKGSPAMCTCSKVPSAPSSPAMGTRSKKRLHL